MSEINVEMMIMNQDQLLDKYWQVIVAFLILICISFNEIGVFISSITLRALRMDIYWIYTKEVLLSVIGLTVLLAFFLICLQ